MSGLLLWGGLAALGGLGALARFELDGRVQLWAAGEFPLGTFVVNVAGSFVLGLLTGLSITGNALFLAGVGFLGSFTTFSTWMLETERLERGRRGQPRAREPGPAAPCGRRFRGGGVGGRSSAVKDSLKLTVYFGESDLIGHRLVSDELFDAFERAGLQAAVLMRAVEGFGIKHKLRTQRFLTLSEDLPLVAVAVDERAAIEAVLPDCSSSSTAA